MFVSHQLRRSFARVGLTYGYNDQSLTTLTPVATNYFTYLNYQGVAGPNSLSGITSSTITPTYSYNTVNHPITPTAGKRLSASFAITGLGGNVNTLMPVFDAAYFRHGFAKNHVMGFHLLGRFLMGYGGKVAPPYSRFYMGGENDIRGFQNWSISPAAFIPNSVSRARIQQRRHAADSRTSSWEGYPPASRSTMNVPIYQTIFPGGDTQGVFNYEYRIPIIGPVTLAPFVDVGVNRISLPSQLTISSDRVTQLNGLYPSGRLYVAGDP